MVAKFATPSKLLTAIRASHLAGVIEALESGADIEEADIHGCVGLPLRTACFVGNVDVVRELLAKGAHLDAIAADGPGAPLRLAQRGKHQAVIDLLIEYGAAVPLNSKILAEPESLFPSPPASGAQTPSAPVVDHPVATMPVNHPLIVSPLEDAPAVVVDTEPDLALSDNTIEYLPTAIPEHAIEELDLTACYGVDTNLLDFDLQRLRDTQDAFRQAPEPSEQVKPKSGFWNSSADK